MDTFTAFVLKDLTNSVIVHDRYQNYDSAQLGTLVHQLCCAHYSDTAVILILGGLVLVRGGGRAWDIGITERLAV